MGIELPPDFKEFLRLLDAHHAEYLLIGGYAVAYYGYPRATQDMDLWIAMRPDNADRVVAVLKEFGFDLPEVQRQLFLEENTNVRMGHPPMRIEVLTSISGVTFADCYQRRRVEDIDGIRVSILDLEDLKKNKRESARHKDLDDLEHLP